MAEKKSTALVSTNSENQVAGFIEKAIANNTPIETMEKLFALHREVKADIAKEAFVSAMSRFQAELPEVKKTKKVLNSDNRTIRYQYAPLDAILEVIKKPLADNGLSYSWEVENKPNMIKATAIITHCLGYSASSSFEIPIDAGGYMTAPQKYASALTYAKRYSLTNILGVSTGDEDTDAVDVGKDAKPKDPKAQIKFLLKALKEKNSTVAEVEEAVERLTGFKLIDVNFVRIIGRLEAIKTEMNSDHENK